MSKYTITYHYGESGPIEVEADRVDHKGDWILFMDSQETVLSVRANTVERYERTEKGEGRVPFVA